MLLLLHYLLHPLPVCPVDEGDNVPGSHNEEGGHAVGLEHVQGRHQVRAGRGVGHYVLSRLHQLGSEE